MFSCILNGGPLWDVMPACSSPQAKLCVFSLQPHELDARGLPRVLATDEMLWVPLLAVPALLGCSQVCVCWSLGLPVEHGDGSLLPCFLASPPDSSAVGPAVPGQCMPALACPAEWVQGDLRAGPCCSLWPPLSPHITSILAALLPRPPPWVPLG